MNGSPFIPSKLSDLKIDVVFGTGPGAPASGDLLVRGASIWSNFPAGSNGTVLTSSGGGVIGWAAPGTVDISSKYDKTGGPISGNVTIPLMPTSTPNRALLSLGVAPFDGATSGFYVGNVNGTHIGINESTGFLGDFANWQLNGVSKFRVGGVRGSIQESSLFLGDGRDLPAGHPFLGTLYNWIYDSGGTGLAFNSTGSIWNICNASQAFNIANSAGTVVASVNPNGGTANAFYVNGIAAQTGDLIKVDLAGTNRFRILAGGTIVFSGGNCTAQLATSTDGANTYVLFSNGSVGTTFFKASRYGGLTYDMTTSQYIDLSGNSVVLKSYTAGLSLAGTYTDTASNITGAQTSLFQCRNNGVDKFRVDWNGDIRGYGSYYGAQVTTGTGSNTLYRNICEFRPEWIIANNATRTGRIRCFVYDFNNPADGTTTNAREAWRVDSDGTQALMSFFGVAAVARPNVTGSRGSGAALVSLLAAFASLGLITDSTVA